jgi:hypothetical protein
MNVDVHGALRSAISGHFHPAFAEIRSSSQRRWSSVTFVGARHRYALCVSGNGAEELVDRATTTMLGEDFAIDGHIVADIAVAGRRSRGRHMVEIELEALTVEAN